MAHARTIQRRFFLALAAALGLSAFAGCSGSGASSSGFGSGGGNGSGGGGTGQPGTLSSFTVTATAHNASNGLLWTAPTATDATVSSYDLYRATGTGGAFQLLSPGDTGTEYVDNGITVGTTYVYRLTAHAGNLTSTSNTDSATPGGPTSVGLGDPASNTLPASPLFTAANFQYVGQSGSGHFTMDVTLSHTASVSELRTVQVGGGVFLPTSGVTVSGNHLFIDSVAAGIPAPSLTAGHFVSLTVTVSNTTSSPVVPNGGRLELTGKAPTLGGTETDGPTGFQITLTNNG